MTRRRTNVLIKIAVAVGVLAGLGYLFVRTAYQTRSEPYTIERRHLANWTLTTEQASGPNAPMLVLRSSPELGPALFRDLFSRMMESLTAPTPTSMPLLLQSEYDKAFAGRMTAEALLTLARFARLDSAAIEAQCLASRRISEPGSTRQVYFILFNAPSVVAFREGIDGMVTKAGASATDFDPLALSPIVIIAATDAGFNRWLPLRADANDCVAPIVVN